MHVLYFKKIENRKKNVNRPKKFKMTSFLPEKKIFWLEKTRFAWTFFFLAEKNFFWLEKNFCWLEKNAFGWQRLFLGGKNSAG